MNVHFDFALPDDEVPKFIDPEARAECFRNLAITLAEDLAAATAAVRGRWWLLILSTGARSYLRRHRRYVLAEEAQRVYRVEVKAALRDFRSVPTVDARQSAELTARVAAKIHAADARAQRHYRELAARN